MKSAHMLVDNKMYMSNGFILISSGITLFT
jgi:hypothetical protein